MGKIGPKEAAQQALRQHRPADRMRHKIRADIKPLASILVDDVPNRTVNAQKTAKSAAGAALSVSEFARLGGLARGRKLTPERRQAIARLGAQARWPKKAE